jgi:hypothetical protein
LLKAKAVRKRKRKAPLVVPADLSGFYNERVKAKRIETKHGTVLKTTSRARDSNMTFENHEETGFGPNEENKDEQD